MPGSRPSEIVSSKTKEANAYVVTPSGVVSVVPMGVEFEKWWAEWEELRRGVPRTEKEVAEVAWLAAQDSFIAPVLDILAKMPEPQEKYCSRCNDRRQVEFSQEGPMVACPVCRRDPEAVPICPACEMWPMASCEVCGQERAKAREVCGEEIVSHGSGLDCSKPVGHFEPCGLGPRKGEEEE
jgi:hypothetical protein